MFLCCAVVLHDVCMCMCMCISVIEMFCFLVVYVLYDVREKLKRVLKLKPKPSWSVHHIRYRCVESYGLLVMSLLLQRRCVIVMMMVILMIVLLFDVFADC